jgi:hypothetical protein
LEDKRIEVSLHMAAKAQAATKTFKQSAPGRGEEGNPKRLTPRPDKSLNDKEQKEKSRRDKLKKTRHVKKKAEPEVEGLCSVMVCTAASIPATWPPTTCDITCDGACASGRERDERTNHTVDPRGS